MKRPTDYSKMTHTPDYAKGAGVLQAFSEPYFAQLIREKAEDLARWMVDAHCGGLPDEGAGEEARRMLSDALRSDAGVLMLLEAIVASGKSQILLQRCYEVLPKDSPLHAQLKEWLNVRD